MNAVRLTPTALYLVSGRALMYRLATSASAWTFGAGSFALQTSCSVVSCTRSAYPFLYSTEDNCGVQMTDSSIGSQSSGTMVRDFRNAGCSNVALWCSATITIAVV